MTSTSSGTDRATEGRRRKAIAGGLAALAIAGAGIGIGSAVGADSTPPQPAAVAAASAADGNGGSAPPGAPVSGSAPGRATSAVPKPLADIEAQAEDIVDKVAVGDWAAVTQDVSTMRTDWAAYAPTAPSAGVPVATSDAFTAALDRLGTAAAAQDAAGTAQAANDASGATVEMLARYDLGHPVEIGRLDVLGRQVVIDAGKGDFSAATAQIHQAERQLAAVQPSLAAQGGDQVLAQTRATLAEMQRMADAKDGAGLTTQAKVLLEVVDGMERLYV